VHQGKVVSIQAYGAFVRIAGYHKQGLVRKSEISNFKVDNTDDVVELNQEVWVKVLSITEDKKVNLSMKYVTQREGKDIDPNNVLLMQSQKPKQQVKPSEPKKAIEFDFSLPTICSKCGSIGHLEDNCFSLGKKYEMIPELEIDYTDTKESNDFQPTLSDVKKAMRLLIKLKEKKLKKEKKKSKKDSISNKSN